jgi:hypothetical protein
MKNCLFYIFLFLIPSCIKEDITVYTATLKNNTTHNIIILPFKSGSVLASDTIKLAPNSQFQIANGSTWGKVTGPGFSSQYFGGPNDSNIVVFDNLYRVSHYANTPIQLSSKYYLATSMRNIANPYSYKFETVSVNKHKQKNTHIYEFTEQDYLYAQQ